MRTANTKDVPASPSPTADILVEILSRLNLLERAISHSQVSNDPPAAVSEQQSHEDSDTGSPVLIHCTTCTCHLGQEEMTPGFPQVNASDRWYVVSKGLEVGVFKDWHAVLPLVSGVSGACFQRHKGKRTAEIAFETAKRAGQVSVITV